MCTCTNVECSISTRKVEMDMFNSLTTIINLGMFIYIPKCVGGGV